jgi:hypothetical protein
MVHAHLRGVALKMVRQGILFRAYTLFCEFDEDF